MVCVCQSYLSLLNSFVEGEKPSEVKYKRHEPLTPYLYLDVPGVIDDFYLNIIHWNTQHELLVALTDVLYIWNSESGEANEIYKCSNDIELNTYISSVLFMDDSTVIFGDVFGVLRVIDLTTQRLIMERQMHTDRINSLAKTCCTLATGSRDNTVQLFDTRCEDIVCSELVCHKGEVCGIDFNGSGTYIGTGANDNSVILSDLRMIKPFLTYYHNAAVKAIKFDPTNDYIIATGGGSSDRTIKLMNINNNQLITELKTHSQVTGIVWCDDELMVTHGYPFNTIIFYDTQHWNKTGEFDGHDGRILSIAMNNYGIAATIGSDEMIRVWKVCNSSDSILK
ncbi:hypothetical protein ENUP19_0004G0068 [Entamoeba nuttalli]|uniref:CDC20/Fizzy WD40 domain-containing protein n=1 Tax=Entamoeba nuttalli TaxID=412467 RepID=A0ABQ0D7T5_9EUKA